MKTVKVHELADTFYAPRFQVKLQGEDLPLEVVNDVMQVTYRDNVEEIDSFELVINNYDMARQQPKFEPPSRSDYEGLFDPGKKLELRMGYGEQLQLMLTGEITTLEPNFPAGSGLTLTVAGLNVLHRLRTVPHTWFWEDKRDSEIAKEMGNQPVSEKRPGLDLQVETNPRSQEKAQPYVFMTNEYDIVFLLRRARLHNYDLVLWEAGEKGEKGRHLYFGPSNSESSATVYQLEWGKSLVSFRPTLTTARQVGKVVVRGWNRRKKEPITAEATWRDVFEGDALAEARMQNTQQAVGSRQKIITDQKVRTQNQAAELAENTLRELVKGMVTGRGETIGLPRLRAGSNLRIAGLGDRFNGRYYVTETTHTIGEGGYTTRFSARREEGLK